MGVKIPLLFNELQMISAELKSEDPNWKRINELTGKKRGKLIDRCFHRSQAQLIALVNKANQALIGVEQKGVKIFEAKAGNEMKAKVIKYQLERQTCFDVIQEIEKKVSGLKVNSALGNALHELHRREVSLRYSLGKAHEGLDALDRDKVDEEVLADLRKRANIWKSQQKQVIHPELNELEEEQLKELARYPVWLESVYQDPAYLKVVLDWSLHTFNQVEIIVKCPDTVNKLDHALLKSNVGYVRNLILTAREDEVLAFREVPTKVEGIKRRILTISTYEGSFKTFEPEKQKRFNILKPHKILQFEKGHYILTIEEFLKEMGIKNKREGNISLCADWGFINFHPVKGVWNADLKSYEMPKMTKDNWMEQVPAARIASHEELLAQYGDEVKDRKFFFKVMAGRKNLDLNAFDSHAFWQLYTRMEDGNWKVLNIGMYAYRFPQGVLDGIRLFCKTLIAVLCLLDQNGYYTHRQRAALPLFPTDEQQAGLLSTIYHLIYTSGVFQFAGRNCAYSVQNLTKQFINDLPNCFSMPLTQATTGIPPLDRLLAWANNQWEWLRWLIVSLLHTLFLSHRRLSIQEATGQVNYSTREYFSKHGHVIYNPAYLHAQIERDQKAGVGPFVKGELYWGQTDEKIYQAQARIRKQS